MAGEREPVGFSGAGVEDVEEHALALADLDRIVVAQHAAVDGAGDVVDHQRAVIAGGIVGLPIVQDDNCSWS